MNKTTREFINVVDSFVKTKRIPASKLSALLQAAAQARQIEELVVNVETPKQAVGKPVSPESVQLREKLLALKQKRPGGLFLAPDLAKELGVDVSILNNNLRFLAHNHDLARVVGRASNNQGKRGRAPVIWQFQ